MPPAPLGEPRCADQEERPGQAHCGGRQVAWVIRHAQPGAQSDTKLRMTERWHPESWTDWVAKVREELAPDRRAAFDEWVVNQRAKNDDEAMRAIDKWVKNATLGAAKGDPQGMIGSEIAWKQIERQVFRVLSFAAFAALDANGAVQTSNRTLPYGLLTVESPILNFPVQMPVTHRFNFLQANYVYEVAHWNDWLVANQHDLLVSYGPSRKFLVGAAFPLLHFRIAANTSLDAFYSDDSNMRPPGSAEKLFGNFQYVYPSNPDEEDVLTGRLTKAPVSIGRLT